MTLATVVVVAAAGVGLAAAASTTGEPSTAGEPSAAGRSGDASAPTTHTDPVVPATPTARAPGAPRRHTGSAPTRAKPTHHRTPAVEPSVLVDVYNNSGITGLAADKAALVQDAGWNVAGIDNWYGDIPSNTVYYPGGFRRDAKRLARLLGISRLRPAVAPMQFDRVTVIFTSP